MHHCRLAAERCHRALKEKEAPGAPPLEAPALAEALRYCRYALAAYCFRAEASADASEGELAGRAAALAGLPAAAVMGSELHDGGQLDDPTCPRFFVALDAARGEVVLSVRGTASLSDTISDLTGDPVPFAGGLAHMGMISGARRLREKTQDKLRYALGHLARPRLVLVGHSLGAGVAQLLAILLRGGDAELEEGAGWCLPPEVEMANYFFAAPPAYKVAEEEEEGTGGGPPTPARAAARAAAASATACGVAFALNYDIIPRTSLHNGYNLAQQARAVDAHVTWRKRDILRLLQQASSASEEEARGARCAVAEAVEAALAAAAAGPPPAPNPYARQHPAAARVYHIVGAPGGTAAYRTPLAKASGSGALRVLGSLLQSAARTLADELGGARATDCEAPTAGAADAAPADAAQLASGAASAGPWSTPGCPPRVPGRHAMCQRRVPTTFEPPSRAPPGAEGGVWLYKRSVVHGVVTAWSEHISSRCMARDMLYYMILSYLIYLI